MLLIINKNLVASREGAGPLLRRESSAGEEEVLRAETADTDPEETAAPETAETGGTGKLSLTLGTGAAGEGGTRATRLPLTRRTPTTGVGAGGTGGRTGKEALLQTRKLLPILTPTLESTLTLRKTLMRMARSLSGTATSGSADK